MTKKRGRRSHHTDEFKREAVSLYRTSQASAATVSRELGISEGSLWRWLKDMPEEKSDRQKPTYEELEARLASLEAELSFLKKSSSYFASKQKIGIG